MNKVAKYEENLEGDLVKTFLELNLNNIHDVNRWLDNNKNHTNKIKENFICIQDKHETDKIQYNMTECNLSKYINEHYQDLNRYLDRKLKIYISLEITDESGYYKEYEGYITKLTSDNLILEFDNITMNILKQNYENFNIRYIEIYKVISKKQQLIKVKDYIDILRKSDDLKKYRHKLSITNYTTCITIVFEKDKLQNAEIIQKHMNDNIIRVIMD
ncbi:hypothetical protein Z968_11295 [Clostridium novyi A str. 4552]|uniref:Uncharacterized protein n=1 Tax=Clostridium novyi A str. 4552 TaxID=1444289 RepID=A0A0A0I1H1_CLONO|nr:hypothetical protein [Clostridium novyi]KGM94642.1 hypothetical protein Z968_11295 [Clostridium novyi A str. 4552]